MQNKTIQDTSGSFWALVPFLVFLVFYLGLSIWAGDFYKVPMTAAFIVAAVSAFIFGKRRPFYEKVEIFAGGMGENNIMIMCMVFILAGVFAAVAKGMGAVESAVVIARNMIPDNLMLCGLFLVSCFISLAVGTSCGTIATLAPIGIALGKAAGVPAELMLGAVVGGAMFGDNMSMISDTTIAATRTQNVAMRDKFIINLKMALPAAFITLLIYLFSGSGSSAGDAPPAVAWRDILLVMPYIVVLICALCNLNVMAVLFGGALFAVCIGIFTGKFDLWQALTLSGHGSLGMAETLIVALLAGGLLGMIRRNGGIRYIIGAVERHIAGQRACEGGIALLVTAVNLFTANNTVAIVIAGPLARELAAKYSCHPKRIASILDTASCVVQGLLPYGAQILIAVGVAHAGKAGLSTPFLLGSMYYQILMAVMLIIFILIPPRNMKNTEPHNI